MICIIFYFYWNVKKGGINEELLLSVEKQQFSCQHTACFLRSIMNRIKTSVQELAVLKKKLYNKEI